MNQGISGLAFSGCKRKLAVPTSVQYEKSDLPITINCMTTVLLFRYQFIEEKLEKLKEIIESNEDDSALFIL